MRTTTYITSADRKSDEQILEIRKALESIFGPLRLRGRHPDRKSVLGSRWRRGAQNDVPWKLARRVDFYLHDSNPNYQRVCKGLSIKRLNYSK